MACMSVIMQMPARRTTHLCRANSVDDERTRPKKIVDTRIHWSSPDEGWIRFDDDDDQEQGNNKTNKESKSNKSSDSISDMLSSSGTHYEFLGVSRAADVEDIRLAYRRLSKLYHPDTTSLPLDVAEKKFFRLREAHNTLTSQEERKRYDQSLEISYMRSSSSNNMAMPIWPYEVDPATATRRSQKESTIPKVSRQKQPYMHPVDRLDGRNMPLSDQAQTALGFDLIAIAFSIFTIIYVGVFKHGFDKPFISKW